MKLRLTHLLLIQQIVLLHEMLQLRRIKTGQWASIVVVGGVSVVVIVVVVCHVLQKLLHLLQPRGRKKGVQRAQFVLAKAGLFGVLRTLAIGL